MRYTKDVAIIVPVTELDDQTAREAVWQQVTERIIPQMGKLCTRFEPSAGAWGQKLSAPYSVVLGRSEPALFLYFYASAKHQLDERAKAHLDGASGIWERADGRQHKDVHGLLQGRHR